MAKFNRALVENLLKRDHWLEHWDLWNFYISTSDKNDLTNWPQMQFEELLDTCEEAAKEIIRLEKENRHIRNVYYKERIKIINALERLGIKEKI